MSTPGGFQVGSTITNGSRAVRLTGRSEKGVRWEVQGWHGIRIGIVRGDTGEPDFVPDYVLGAWRHVPFEWTPMGSGALDERYVWTPDCRRLKYETRPVVPPG